MIRRLPLVIAALLLAAGVAIPSVAFARCTIKNETKYSFTVESGNTSNQSVGANTTTTIADGKIIGKSKEGKTVSGFCKAGDTLVIKEDKGVPILMPK